MTGGEQIQRMAINAKAKTGERDSDIGHGGSPPGANPLVGQKIFNPVEAYEDTQLS